MSVTQETTVPNTHEMVVIHRMFRREFGLLPGLVRDVRIADLDRARVVADHAEDMLTRLHTHHTGEDESLWPRLLERARPDADLIERMQAQHELVATAIERSTELLPRWRATAEADLREELAEILTQLATQLVAHLDEEEANVLPLVRRYISVAEWDELGRHGMANVPKRGRLHQLGAILEAADPAEIELFLEKLPGFVRVIWNVVGRRQYRRYTLQVRGH